MSREPKNIVICFDGTNNRLQAAVNTNVVRLFAMLDLDKPTHQVGYYDPGVGTFASPAAWSPPARTLSRVAGMAFGAGLRQNLGEAYLYLIEQYVPEDKIYVFGFSRGAYSARALTGMLDVFGIFRQGSQHLVPYAVNAYARQTTSDGEARGQDPFAELRMYAKTHGTSIKRRRDHVGVHFVGLWDTVKAAGTIGRQLRWPYTRQLPHVSTVRHAVAIDEARRPYVEYLLNAPNPQHLLVQEDQDRQEVWFPGVHSDVGGMFAEGALLSDIPLKWMVDEAISKGLLVRPLLYSKAAKLTGVDPTAPIHTNSPWWRILGRRRRQIPGGALIHASVKERVSADPNYLTHLPADFSYIDHDWRKPKPVRTQ